MIEDCELIFRNTRSALSVCDEDLVRLGDVWRTVQRLNVRRSFTSRADRFLPDIQHPAAFGLMELARRCPMLRYVHLVAFDASVLPQMDAAPRLVYPLQELTFQYVHNVTSEKRCAAAERLLNLAFPRLDIALSKAQCGRLNARPETKSQWRRILLLMWILRCRSSGD